MDNPETQVLLTGFQEMTDQLFPLFVQRTFRGEGLSCTPVPVSSIPLVSFLPMKIGMYPVSFLGPYILGDIVRALPIAPGLIPHRQQMLTEPRRRRFVIKRLSEIS